MIPGTDETGAYAPPDTPLRVIHRDDAIVLLDKPAGLLSVPGKGDHLADCLLSRLQAEMPGALLVHRLDRDTSGIMIFALTPRAQRHLGLQFERRQMRKVYVARVHGLVADDTGTVDLPLKVDWPNRPLQHVHPEGKAAQTDWRVVERIRAGTGAPDGGGPSLSPAEGSETRVQLYPRTGRSHQLRVHMLSIGHPILGDPFYAPGDDGRQPRMMLHALELRFRHPDGGATVAYSAPCPF